MSAKDSFIKQVQRNKDAENSHVEQVSAEINIFRSRMCELARDVEQWLYDIDIQVIVTNVSLNDETIPSALRDKVNCRYDIPLIKLQNGRKSALLKAEGLYGRGTKGHVSLTITDPDRAPSHSKFSLFMSTSGLINEGWKISPYGQNCSEDMFLTEESFFSAIKALA